MRKKTEVEAMVQMAAKFGTGLYKLSVFGVGKCERRGKRKRDGDR